MFSPIHKILDRLSRYTSVHQIHTGNIIFPVTETWIFIVLLYYVYMMQCINKEGSYMYNFKFQKYVFSQISYEIYD